jgi:photosystem II stability/assembly factor-like uncharacterized protein
MAARVLVLIGTRKGAFIAESDPRRSDWSLRGPYCDTWPINHLVADEATGHLYGGGGGEWEGPAVWKSTDLGATWTKSSEGFAYGDGEPPIKSVWSVAPGKDRIYAGVDPAGLFASEDGGATWRHVAGLRDHPSRPHWQPGGAGLVLHHILRHPDDPDQLWVGISTAGVFHSADSGATWQPRNSGTRCDFVPEGADRYPEFGQCVHSIAMAAGGTGRLYQQNHCGMYRSGDGGRSWTSIENGLPSSFGFGTAAHPRDPATLWLVPLNGDVQGRYAPDGKLAVWRTRDSGESWQALRNGLPQQNAFVCVLRQAMATDRLDPTGVYVGTNSGQLYASADEGDAWSCIAGHLPGILSVKTLVVEG